VGNASLASVTLNVQISINNPNLLPVYIPSGSFTVYLNGQRLGVGDFGSLTIGGNSQGVISAPVIFNATDVPSVLFGIITGRGKVTVNVVGSANLVLFNVPFNSTVYNTTIS
jgi:LEA14-like dessication related protein